MKRGNKKFLFFTVIQFHSSINLIPERASRGVKEKKNCKIQIVLPKLSCIQNLVRAYPLEAKVNLQSSLC